MTLKIVGVAAGLCAAALTLPVAEASARGAKGGPVVASFVRPGVPMSPRPFAFHHHRRGLAGGFWPAGGYYYGGPYSSGEPVTEASAPLSTDVNVNYTYKQDVPWDWAHRFPPMVTPGDRPYVPGCSNEPVTVGARGGGEHTVNVIRCY
jgi:hypothetical protein